MAKQATSPTGKSEFTLLEEEASPPQAERGTRKEEVHRASPSSPSPHHRGQ